MLRLFDEHIKRPTRSLDGAWKFKVDKENIGVSESWFLGLKEAETVTVPSVTFALISLNITAISATRVA